MNLYTDPVRREGKRRRWRVRHNRRTTNRRDWLKLRFAWWGMPDWPLKSERDTLWEERFR